MGKPKKEVQSNRKGDGHTWFSDSSIKGEDVCMITNSKSGK